MVVKHMEMCTKAARAEHYILKGVTDALFLDFETTTIEYWTRTNAR